MNFLGKIPEAHLWSKNSATQLICVIRILGIVFGFFDKGGGRVIQHLI